MAIASVQEGVNGLAPVPTQFKWAEFAQRQGHTTVEIQRVTEPVSCASAVANGRITDPGVTAQQVDAEVTFHTTDHGKATTNRSAWRSWSTVRDPWSATDTGSSQRSRTTSRWWAHLELHRSERLQPHLPPRQPCKLGRQRRLLQHRCLVRQSRIGGDDVALAGGSATSVNLDSPQRATDLVAISAIAVTRSLALFLVQVITSVLRGNRAVLAGPPRAWSSRSSRRSCPQRHQNPARHVGFTQ